MSINITPLSSCAYKPMTSWNLYHSWSMSDQWFLVSRVLLLQYMQFNSFVDLGQSSLLL